VLTRLPTTGRLLVNSSNGPWIVSADGAKRHLGGAAYAQASWSPHGLFEVVVLHGRELAAIDPKGNVRWSLARRQVSDARWSEDGFRIAYRSGTTLRVVAGDGTGDHLLARGVAVAPAAWNGASHQIAYADLRGRVHLADADTRVAVWTSKAGPLPTQIAWEPGGRQVVAIGRAAVRVLHARDGRLFKQIALPPGSHQLAISPTGPAAVTAQSARGQSSILLLHPQHPWLAPRPIFRGAGRFNSVVWSPDGRWLLASWASADQWVFIKLGIRTGAIEHVRAVSSIAPAFDSEAAPSFGGWCCPAGSPP
jgi:dipeptidyl aminopeptidase/acylaminoacyl peptidase